MGMTMAAVDLRRRDLETLTSVFRRFPHIREVLVFGSRANGTAKRASDIDLAIAAPDATPSEWLELLEALDEAPIIYELDVVRREQLSNERLREKIEREGVRIYPPAA